MLERKICCCTYYLYFVLPVSLLIASMKPHKGKEKSCIVIKVKLWEVLWINTGGKVIK
jgi:hypothetical protein